MHNGENSILLQPKFKYLEFCEISEHLRSKKSSVRFLIPEILEISGNYTYHNSVNFCRRKMDFLLLFLAEHGNFFLLNTTYTIQGAYKI